MNGVEISKAAAFAVVVAAIVPALMLWTLLAWDRWLEGEQK